MAIALIAITFLLSDALTIFAQQGQGPVRLLQLTHDQNAVKATAYLKILVEQRANHRLAVNLYPAERLDTANYDIVITDKEPAPNNEQRNKLILLAKEQDNHYRVLATNDFLSSLPADLKIILMGAVQDTMTYMTELHGLKSSQH